MKNKINKKKWAAGNVLYIPEEDQLWLVKGYVQHREKEEGLAFLIAGIDKDGIPQISIAPVGPEGDVAPERNTILIGRL